MAGGSAKKIATENSKALRQYMIGNLVSAGLFAVVRMFLFYNSLGFWGFVLFGLVNVVQVGVYVLFSRQVNKGLDINTPGLNEYLQDVLYVSWGVLGLTCITDYAWYLLLLIPAYAGYQAWVWVIKPFFKSRSAMKEMQAAAQAQTQDQDSGSKRRDKEKRIVYGRGR